jgi:RNA polymerase sigma factor (sigma-70 family)
MKVPFKGNNQSPALRLSDAPGEEVDRELARQMSDGSREALTRFVDRHASYLYKYLQRRLGPGNDALVQAAVKATLETAFRRRRPYATGSARTPMRLWLLRLAEREIAKRRRALRPTPADASTAVESEDLVALREAIASLKRRQQAAMCLALFEELSTQEIAGALGMREARAMRVLRAALRRTGSALALAHAEVP